MYKIDRLPPLYLCNHWDRLGTEISGRFSGNTVFVFSQSGVWKKIKGPIQKSLRRSGFSIQLHLLPEGEAAKSWLSVKGAWQFLFEHEADRHSLIVAVGGGTVGDAAGFIASTFKRGIPFVSVPTTLLAQVDSAIGGKVGINDRGIKNSIGTFYFPEFIYIQPGVLRTLPERALRSGLAEVIKAGILGDSRLFSLLEKATSRQKLFSTLQEILSRAIRVKTNIVKKDPHELKGIRYLLNFGHTMGHAIESEGKYRRWTHGEAVAAGMMMEAKIAHSEGFCSQQTLGRLQSLLKMQGLPVEVKGPIDWMPRIRQDKKRDGNEISMVMLRKIGKAEVKKINLKKLNQCIQNY